MNNLSMVFKRKIQELTLEKSAYYNEKIHKKLVKKLLKVHFDIEKDIDDINEDDEKVLYNWQYQGAFTLDDLLVLIDKDGADINVEDFLEEASDSYFRDTKKERKNKKISKNYIYYMSYQKANEIAEILECLEYGLYLFPKLEDIYIPVAFHFPSQTMFYLHAQPIERSGFCKYQCYWVIFSFLSIEDKQVVVDDEGNHYGNVNLYIPHDTPHTEFKKMCRKYTQNDEFTKFLKDDFIPTDVKEEIVDLIKDEYIYRMFTNVESKYSGPAPKNEGKKSLADSLSKLSGEKKK